MTFDIHLLDKLSYDKAEPLLEDYIADMIDLFFASDHGQAYAKNHPDGGHWIGTFIEISYLYGNLTLPKMLKRDVQQVMEFILPRKILLVEPGDADDAIPELVAFWTFLHQRFKFRSAKAITQYLESIQDQFHHWMFDPAQGSFTKTFMMQGLQAGYDVTTPTGLEAFRVEYNQRIADDPLLPPIEDQRNALSQLLGTLALNLFEGGNTALPQQQSLSSLMLGAEAVPLSETDITVLEDQTITTTEPGALLQDFQTVIDYIGVNGIATNGKRHQFPLKILADLNQRLSNPIKIALKRPQQKSYPYIHGLYLLLRATGILNVVAQGKQHRLVLNNTLLHSWQLLNPTERYGTLLEAWLIRSHEDMLSVERSGLLNEGIRCLQAWSALAAKKRHTYQDYKDQEQLSYWLGLHNLALMDLFGLIKITAGSPKPGKGWRITKVETLPLGKALMLLIKNAYLANSSWLSEQEPTQPFNQLQPILTPYFPAWKQTFAIPQTSFRPGRHIFKVSLGKVWRRLAIRGDATLADLSDLILTSVDFSSDHLDQFTYTNELGRKVEVTHPQAGGERSTHQVKIGSLPLNEGSSMDYLFDFGDCWEFQVQLETIETESDHQHTLKSQHPQKRKKQRTSSHLGEILEVHGSAPAQYPVYDDD